MAVDAKIAVTGPHGRLGSELVRQGCIPVEANVTDFMALRKVLQEIDPDVVIHCAAYTDVDMCEQAPLHAVKVNMGGTFGLSQVFTGKIVYISTDYVFDGLYGPYNENDRPNPISIYGWSKLGGEIVLRNRGNPSDLIVRTTMLFDAHTDNFVTVVARRLLAGDKVSLPANLFGSPTYVPHLTDGILEAIKRDVGGIVNLVGRHVISRWEFGVCIASKLKINNVVASSVVDGRAPRPLNAGLRVNRARSLGLPIGDPLDGLEEVINALETVETG